MMWGNGYNNMAWGWPLGLLISVVIIVLVIWAVRAIAGGTNREGRRGDAAGASPKGGRSQARQILDDRFARGEPDATEYRERLKVLEDKA